MLRDESSYRAKLGKGAQRLRAALRRMAVTATANALWTLAGAQDEDDSDVEVFSGIGFYSRPPETGGSPEVVLVKIGGASAHPAIVATRDERTRQAFTQIRDMLADESAMFNSQARVHCLADGTVVVDDGTGAVELALKSDVQGVKDAIAAAAVSAGDGGATFKTNIGTGLSGFPVGTTILKGK